MGSSTHLVDAKPLAGVHPRKCLEQDLCQPLQHTEKLVRDRVHLVCDISYRLDVRWEVVNRLLRCFRSVHLLYQRVLRREENCTALGFAKRGGGRVS